MLLFSVSLSTSSAEPAGLSAESATECVVEIVHVAESHGFLRIDLILLVNFGQKCSYGSQGQKIAVNGSDRQENRAKMAISQLLSLIFSLTKTLKDLQRR